MPTYEYECSSCGKQFEAFQKMSDKPLTTCRICKARGKVKRLISAGAGLIFKGNGFYQTDYKKISAQNDKPEPKPQCDSCDSTTCPKPKKEK
ncbi:MAG: zinc ribbon domain-containing protein [Candidatus Omnitrophica bacterium]|nr:zinc ribbon domain-containing protein [Candidatus Omnitrophota bacterium]